MTSKIRELLDTLDRIADQLGDEGDTDSKKRIRELTAEIRALASPDSGGTAEPVAWLWTNEYGKKVADVFMPSSLTNAVPLYAAPPAPTASPACDGEMAVKPLEWQETEGNYEGQTVWSPGNDIWPCWIVKNPGSRYVWCEEIGIEMVPASPIQGSYDTLDEAKAAAEVDYERRIRSALVKIGGPNHAE